MKHCFIEYGIYVKIKVEFFQFYSKLFNRKIIVDRTGTRLTPGNGGRGCHGNGAHLDWRGRQIECCCDECDYLLCCLGTHRADACMLCMDKACPRSRK